MALSHFLCAVPKTLDALFSVASLSRFVYQPIGKQKPFSASILPSIIIPQPHRRNCSAVSVPSTSEGQQLVRSPQLVALEYADLNLSDSFSEEVGHVRIRQHVNPLSASFSVPAPVPKWSEVYRDPTLPLVVDVGSAGMKERAMDDVRKGTVPEWAGIMVERKAALSTLQISGAKSSPILISSIIEIPGSGRFLMWLAKRNLERSQDPKNYLGLEIRQKVWEQFPLLVKRAEYWANELALSNIHFIFANATVSFKELVSTYPGPLMLVSILVGPVLCPDPHFKKKYHKRRVVQKHLVESIVDCLMPGGQVFIQSDVLEVALDMREKFDAFPDGLLHVEKFNADVLCDNEGWLLSNPMGIRTEREIHAEFEGAKIYRRLYQKRI
ncbi:hypothetical protein RHSIM_Rhsim03G0068300 [Rhododendron simsii]|uniref:tRNA (guanine(46)-N(7))-methyltransferase n=2 Tax=Magnoliopsida TaxID=3398 RepID=A0A834H726_RHOSS|nr:hypothetical protein RHSIM_Rhsim03G0068300 [Rhododendron simsii]